MKSINKLPIIIGMLMLTALITFAKQEKVLQIFRNGEIIQEYNVADIDYIEVNDLVPAPEDVNASVTDNQITIKWNAVEGATYNVYRSADNKNFVLLASNLTVTTYMDYNPLRGTNFYHVKAVINGAESGSETTVAATIASSDMRSGIYLGITGFNSELYEYPIQILTENTKEGYEGFVNSLSMADGTLLYYSVDEALNALQKTELPADLSNVAIVTFTEIGRAHV